VGGGKLFFTSGDLGRSGIGESGGGMKKVINGVTWEEVPKRFDTERG